MLKAHQQVNLEEESIQQVFCCLQKTPHQYLYGGLELHTAHTYLKETIVCL